MSRLYNSCDLASARGELASWLQFWEGRAPRLARWVEENIEETFSFFSLPEPHRRHMRSTNMLERLNQEIKRRSKVVRVFPNRKSCRRLVLALLIRTHERWQKGPLYLDMQGGEQATEAVDDFPDPPFEEQDVAQAAAANDAGTALRAAA